MTKREHLQFLVLMIPTFLILAAAVATMGASGAGGSTRSAIDTAAAPAMHAETWDDRPPAE